MVVKMKNIQLQRKAVTNETVGNIKKIIDLWYSENISVNLLKIK